MTAAAKPKRQVRRELVEGELLERAAKLFTERGFSGTTLQDVADTVGLTRASIYHYFESKEALLASLVEGITVGRAAELKKIRADASLRPAEKLARVTRMMALNVAAHAARFRLLLQSEHELPAHLAETHARGRRETLRELVALFEEGAERGELRSGEPHVSAFALLGMCNWIAWWHRPAEGRPTAEEIAEQFVEIAQTAFRAAPARPVPAPRAEAHRSIQRLRDELAALERLIQPR